MSRRYPLAAVSGAPPGQQSGIGDILDWNRGYVRRHLLESLATVGGQVMLALKTLRYLL
ncbi:hypothetical protein [Mycolicibacterium sp. CBMA 234]|uniref:hypothetical protein n=1 Tax=Mycolicibacterium sp. CBMA 234 TaxID=1918495 RepID=UPI0012DF4D07|nr:hypothetical protein [Mycolicibacterium sp. CBMA 234]